MKHRVDTRTYEVIVTQELLEAGKSSAGSWSLAQLRWLGVPMPRKKGWRTRLLGTRISRHAVSQFLALKDAHLVTSLAPEDADASV